jgi:hypothetical protein
MNALHRTALLVLSGTLLGATPGAAQTISAELVAGGFSTPTEITAPPGDPRLFVAELPGRLRVIENGALLPTPYFDVSSLVQGGAYTGLRGVAFHPDYATNGYVYYWYEAPAGAQPDVVLDRMTVSASDPNVADPSTRVEILRFSQDQMWHGGGHLAFGPDGYLYVGTGDGWGLGMDPGCNAQNGQLLNGKMLRIDVDSGLPYAIPPDNPFVGDPTVRDEIWHIGFRHPWRWSFDRETGDMYVGDSGESTREEVDFIPAGVGGLNFGWKVMEGTSCYNTSGCSGVAPCNDPVYTPPIHEFNHATGCSIIGGYVYRGSAIPSLQGHYMYADWCTGRMWSFRYSGGSVLDFQQRTAELGGPFGMVNTWGEDAAGEVYFAVGTGQVYKLRPDCGATSYCSGLPNSAGAGATISSSGSTSVNANDFWLHAAGAIPGRAGIFFYGPDQASLPFGDGLRCVGGGSFRLYPPIVVDGAGQASRQLDFTQPPASAGPGEILDGSVWNFQFWYRDPAGPGGAGFNLSDALAVVFCN